MASQVPSEPSAPDGEAPARAADGGDIARWIATRPGLLVAGGLALVVIWTLYPLWPHLGDHLLGDPDADAIRGMWGFDFLRHSLVPPDTPVRSEHVNFPFGVVSYVLPWASGLLAAPLVALLGPFTGWNLTVALLLWAAGMCVAWLVRVLTGSWAAGGVAGAALMTQPMLLAAVGDGTAEHVAVWGIAAFLAAVACTLRARRIRWGIAAGLLAAVVALDSPYHVVYTAVIAAITLPFLAASPEVRKDWKRAGLALAATLLVAGICAGWILYVYRYLPTVDRSGLEAAALQSSNATDPALWLQYLRGMPERDPTRVPTFIPMIPLLILVGLAIVGRLRAAPWLAAGLMLILLSCGTHPAWPDVLVGINGALFELPGLSSIRFPRRLLVPGAMALCVAAGWGLVRLRPRIGRAWPAVAVVAGATLAVWNVHATRLHRGFPLIEPPAIEFASWIGDQPGSRAVILLPHWRPHVPGTTRENQPTFAAIEGPIASSDTLYIQVLHGRPALTYPQLKTLRPYDRDEGVVRLLRDWNDLTLPLLQQRPIVSSATNPEFDEMRATALDLLLEAGLQYLAVDLTAYNEEALSILRAQLGEHHGGERRFGDGGGVLVILLVP